MRIVVAHNFYQQSGGEDQVFAAEVDLLRRFGHTVETFVMHNDAVAQMGGLRTAAAAVWNRKAGRSLAQLVRAAGAQVVHFHNTFPLISPAGYRAARSAGAAVVQTLHNFRVICPSAVLYRNGHVCESCVNRMVPWPGIVHACYRSSRSGTAVVAGMVSIHRMLRTWRRAVDAYIAPTPSARAKLIQGGLPADRLVIKPNFVDPDPGPGRGSGGYAVFVGRLSQEKGLETLLDAWKRLGATVPLKIVGDGPLRPLVLDVVARQSNIEWLGRRSLDEVYDLLGEAAMLVFPSRCYETFGRAIIEAFAKATPVIASRHGAMADLIADGRTGRLFEPGNADDLACKIRELLANPASLRTMRAAARVEFESHYTGGASHQQLIAIYERAIAQRHSAAPAHAVRQAESLTGSTPTCAAPG